jgi:D-arabinose 5-phosphate isomerase GutQ
LAGIGKSILPGSELVSTIAKTGMPSLFASLTAICSYIRPLQKGQMAAVSDP